jgi:hypothetical protein
MNCALTVERLYRGEEGVFVGIFRAPEQQTLQQIQDSLVWYKNESLEKVGYYRQVLRFGRIPTPIRRLFWWGTLNVSGYKRCKRFGTFGLSSYGALGAESYHPISPLTTTMTYGPIDDAGRVLVKLIYDHRVLDGAYIARRLRDIEDTLHGPILAELQGRLEDFAQARSLSQDHRADHSAAEPPGNDSTSEMPLPPSPLSKPHLPRCSADRNLADIERNL